MNKGKLADTIIMAIMVVSAIGMIAVNTVFLVTNDPVFITNVVYRIPAMGAVAGLTSFCVKDYFFDKK